MVNAGAIATKMDVRKVISSFFAMLKEDIYVLIRIEFLVALVTVMFFVMFILDIFRCRSRSSILNTVLQTVNDLSDHIVAYLLGAMQSARFENQMFPVWAIVLVSLRVNLCYLSGYNISDHQRRLAELGNVIKFLGVGLLNGTRGLKFSRPLWSLWAILQLRCIYRCYSHNMAISSLWHGRSSEFLPQYMSAGPSDCEQEKTWTSTGQPSNCEQEKTSASTGQPSNCEQEEENGSASTGQQDKDRAGNNQSYLVYGESNQEITLKKPGYTLQLNVVDAGSLITLEKIMESEKLLTSDNNGTYQDMSMAFTLSRLIRCRLEDVPLDKKSIDSSRDLIKSIISCNQQTASAVTVPEVTEGDARIPQVVAPAKCAFKILELELAFVRDYFCTLYPVVFCKGLLSLCISLLLSVATFALAFWLAVGIRKAYQPNYESSHTHNHIVLWVGEWNVDVVLTWVFMIFMMFKEVWEIVTYLLSNWTRLLLVCKYVHSGLWFMKCTGSFFVSNIVDPWHGRIDQYDFLQSLTYKPSFWQLANTITLGKTPAKLDGHKSGKAIKIPECVKSAMLQALRRIGLDSPVLPRDIPSLNGSTQEFQRYSWACLDLDTCSQVILVWHVATSLCEMEPAQDSENDSTSPGFLPSAWSYLKLKAFSCCTSKNIHLTGEHKTNYLIATSLSRYCAYLQVFPSELLPDSFVVPDLIFEETLKNAREQLDVCNVKADKYSSQLKKIAGEAEKKYEEAAKEEETEAEAKTNYEHWRLSLNIVQQGAILGKALIEHENEGSRWKILAGVWADLLLHIAPTWNALAHKESLESGGEFITIIWALLCHCGIEKSMLWDKNTAPQGNAVVSQQDNGETSDIQHIVQQQVPESNAEATQECSPEISEIQPWKEQPDEDGIISGDHQDPDTSDSTSREDTNARAETANQTPTANEASNGISPNTSTN